MDYLRKIYKDDLEDTIVSFINAETTKARGSLIDVLKHGIEISNRQLDLMYTKPATTFNPELTKKYGRISSPSWRRSGPATKSGSMWSFS